MVASPSGQIEGHAEGTAEFGEFSGGEGSDIVGEVGFAEADEVVAHDPAFVLHAFVGADGDLGRQAFSGGKNGGTDYGRKAGIDQGLAADDNEGSELLRIAAWPGHAVKFASPHGLWRDYSEA